MEGTNPKEMKKFSPEIGISWGQALELGFTEPKPHMLTLEKDGKIIAKGSDAGNNNVTLFAYDEAYEEHISTKLRHLFVGLELKIEALKRGGSA